MKNIANRHWISILLAAAVIAALVSGCGTEEKAAGDDESRAGISQTTSQEQQDPNELVSREIFAMDTYMGISAYGEDAEAALDEAEAEILLVAIIAGMACKERFFCQFLCPMGAVFTLLPQLPFSALQRDADNCIKGCQACKNKCPVIVKAVLLLILGMWLGLTRFAI